jgi:hypothetical protein
LRGELRAHRCVADDVRRSTSELTLYTRVPYGPRRPSAGQIVVWIALILVALLPLAVVDMVFLIGTEDMDQALPF